MARPEYPTSIRLTVIDKRRLRKYAEKSKRSLAGLIQMILLEWLKEQEKTVENSLNNNDDQRTDGPVPLPQAGS
jgi:hypothetical protein